MQAKIKIFKVFKKEMGLDKYGKPSVLLAFDDGNGKSYSVFSNGKDEYMTWSKGDEKEFEYTESERTDKNGRPYLNIVKPKKGAQDNSEMKAMLSKILEDLAEIKSVLKPKSVTKQRESADEF